MAGRAIETVSKRRKKSGPGRRRQTGDEPKNSGKGKDQQREGGELIDLTNK